MIRKLLPPYSFHKIFGHDVFSDYISNSRYEKYYDFAHDLIDSINKVYYWIAHRTWDRYHIVDTGLSPGYYDTDEIMFHACFQLLGKFVELELGRMTSLDPEDDEAEHRGYRLHSTSNVEPTAIDLWLWYRDDLPEIEKTTTSTSALIKIKDDKIKELMEIRTGLWT